MGDGADQNCDGTDGIDVDGDGHASQASGGDDCDDEDPATHPGVDEDGWTVDTIPGDSDRVSGCFAIAVDGDGTAHVAYLATPGGLESPALKYANDATGTWESEVVFVPELDPWGARIANLHIAIDGDGGVHILDSLATGQFDDSTAALWAKVDPGWDQEWTANGGYHPVLARGPSGALHVLYALTEYGDDGTNWPTLHWATNESGQWELSSLGNGWPNDIAVDGSGHDHATFVTDYGDTSGARYLTNESGEWMASDIDAGYPSAIAVDGGGTVHVVSIVAGGEARHAWNSGAEWQSEAIDTWSGARPSTIDLAVDPRDFLHVTYFVDGELRYATNASGSWLIETLAESSLDQSYCGAALAIGAGKVHVVYADTENRHATRLLPDGVDNDCDGVPL